MACLSCIGWTEGSLLPRLPRNALQVVLQIPHTCKHAASTPAGLEERTSRNSMLSFGRQNPLAAAGMALPVLRMMDGLLPQDGEHTKGSTRGCFFLVPMCVRSWRDHIPRTAPLLPTCVHSPTTDHTQSHFCPCVYVHQPLTTHSPNCSLLAMSHTMRLR